MPLNKEPNQPDMQKSWNAISEKKEKYKSVTMYFIIISHI